MAKLREVAVGVEPPKLSGEVKDVAAALAPVAPNPTLGGVVDLEGRGSVVMPWERTADHSTRRDSFACERLDVDARLDGVKHIVFAVTRGTCDSARDPPQLGLPSRLFYGLPISYRRAAGGATRLLLGQRGAVAPCARRTPGRCPSQKSS